jgi:soluble lytic murein transglycosylase-like protein
MDLDEFLETVPFNGARTYPMRVLQYLSTYRALHAGNRAIYIGNALERRTLNNIYF